MADPKIYKLILNLYDKTKNGEVKWARSIDKEFITSFRDYSVGVSQAKYTRYTGRNLRDSNVILKIYDAGGEEIESTASTDFDTDSGALNAYDMLDYIYENARRMALGVDTALDTLLMELGA